MSLELVVGTAFYALVSVAMLIRDSRNHEVQKQIWETYLSLLKEMERQREEMLLLKQEIREMKHEIKSH